MSARLQAGSILAAALVLLILMPAWTRQPTESYAQAPDAFLAKAEAMAKAHATGRTTETGQPIVRPPPGDIYMTARRFSFYPALELELGQNYRLHVASQDVVHGFHLSLNNAERLLVPGRVEVVALTADRSGRHTIVCADYCGPEHNGMHMPLTVVSNR